MLERTLYLFSTFTLLSVNTHAQEVTEEDYTHQLDSIEQLFSYRHDTVELANGVGKIIVPDGLRDLDTGQSEKVLVEDPEQESQRWGRRNRYARAIDLIAKAILSR